MEEKIKDIEVIAYKGMKFNMSCKGFKYEIGKTYKTDKAELCKCGFHACLNPIDVLDYYLEKGSRYFKVKLSGEITNCSTLDTNVAATKITILEEINIKEAIKTDWWKNKNVIDLLYFSEGFAIVRRDDKKYNFIDKDGKLLSDKWFKWADDFENGFAKVEREDDKYNLITKDGKLLFDEWFKYASFFHEGFAIVRRDDKKYNFIDKDGKILSEQWFKWAGVFHEGFAIVQRTNGEWNFIGKDGKLLSDEWFKNAYSFDDDFAIVEREDGSRNFIDKKGKLLFDEWLKDVYDFQRRICNSAKNKR